MPSAEVAGRTADANCDWIYREGAEESGGREYVVACLSQLLGRNPPPAKRPPGLAPDPAICHPT